MKRVLFIVVATILLLALASPVLADESRYNFASAQGDKQISVTPGGEGKGVIYFYNIDGNRITHINLKVNQPPEDMEVEIQPPSHEIDATVNGLAVTVTENLHVEPSSILTEEPATVPEGMVCINVPSRGYALACPAYIVVKAPASAKIGTTAEITVAAEAEWLGQSGAAAMKQARDFTFSVAIVSASTEYTETIGGQGETSQAPAETAPAKTPAAESESPGFSLMSWLPAIAAGAIVILGAILIPLLVRKRR